MLMGFGRSNGGSASARQLVDSVGRYGRLGKTPIVATAIIGGIPTC